MKIEDSSFDLTSAIGKILKLAAEDNSFENEIKENTKQEEKSSLLRPLILK